MEDLLNFDVLTTPGEVAYLESSEDMAVLFVISVISEGYKEEPKYLTYVRNICKQNDAAQLVLHIVNRHYKRQQESSGHNHPLKRLEDLLNWKDNHKQIDSCDNKDEYWLICDRDNDTFTSEQYDMLVEKCNQNNIQLIVSNPAFQIWLLLHFTKEICALQLDQYQKSSDCISKGIEPAIKTYVPRYKHGRINMNTFGPLIKSAIDNSFPYSKDVAILKDNYGTNFRDLLLRIEEISNKELFE